MREKDGENRLAALCAQVRALSARLDYDGCMELLRGAMGGCPDAPEPHNLMGIIYMRKGDKGSAMRHFRAAWALDPTYLPARENLYACGTFEPHGALAYDESDCLGAPLRRQTDIL